MDKHLGFTYLQILSNNGCTNFEDFRGYPRTEGKKLLIKQVISEERFGFQILLHEVAKVDGYGCVTHQKFTQ